MRLVWRPIGQWPGEFTRDRAIPSWGLGETVVIRDLLKEVEHLDPVTPEVVVQIATVGGSNDFRIDGELKVHAVLSHPGVIVGFETKKLGVLSLACDRWRSARGTQWNKTDVLANLRGVSLTLTALRAVERYGVGTGRESYQGWAAIGPGTIAVGPAKMSRREAAELLAEAGQTSTLAFDPATTGIWAHNVHAAFRLAAKEVHPDAGGDEAAFKRLVEARDVLISAV